MDKSDPHGVTAREDMASGQLSAHALAQAAPPPGEAADHLALDSLVQHLEPGRMPAFRIDTHGRFSWVPEEAAHMMGFPAGQLLGVVLWERYPRLAGSPLAAACTAVLESRRPARLELRLARLGQWASVVVSAWPEGLVLQFHDITAIVRERARLETRENMLLAIFDAMPMWLSVKDAQCRYLMANRRTLDDTGLAAEDYQNTHTLDLPLGVHAELEEVLRYDRIVLERERPLISHEITHTLADGSERVFRHHKAPFRNPSGEIAGIVTISEDVTAHRRLVDDLAASRRGLQMAQELALMGSWDWEPALASVVWSEGMFTLLRTNAADTAPSYESLLEAVHPQDRERVVSALESIVADGQGFDLEHRLLLADHQVRMVRHRAQMVSGQPGGACRILGTLLDVSDYKRVEQELRANAARLVRSNQDLEAFASAASHDLQEPLRKIAVFGERLQNIAEPLLPPEGLEHLQRILNATHRMRGLIEDLLNYSRISSRGQPLAATELDQVVAEACAALASQTTALGAQIDVGPLPTVWGDANQLRQVFHELLSNALQFARPTVVTRIAIRFAVSDAPIHNGQPLCTLTVTDNGIGFEQKFAERIFGVFKRLHGRDSTHAGTGIGLALCRKIMDRHGGVIYAQSVPGEGTEITLRLPLGPGSP